MKILYLGDIMASPGRRVVAKLLPSLKKEYSIDIVVAQAENVTHGKSMSPAHMEELRQIGIDFFTGGNHSVERNDTQLLLNDPNSPIISPYNMDGYPNEWGIKSLKTSFGDLLFISLLGQTVPKSLEMQNPLLAIDEALEHNSLKNYAAIVVNFHGDYSSEKRVIGYYLDGRVTAVIGDHWHVPTADAMILPSGSAHISDVGMCGTLHSSLGVELEVIKNRWRNNVPTRNKIAETGPFQLNAVAITVDENTKLATKIEQVNKVVEELQ